MSKPLITVHNVQTNEIIEREMTDEEYTQYTATIERLNKKAAEQEALDQAQNAARNKLIDLGLTEEEIAALQVDWRLF